MCPPAAPPRPAAQAPAAGGGRAVLAWGDAGAGGFDDGAGLHAHESADAGGRRHCGWVHVVRASRAKRLGPKADRRDDEVRARALPCVRLLVPSRWCSMGRVGVTRGCCPVAASCRGDPVARAHPDSLLLPCRASQHRDNGVREGRTDTSRDAPTGGAQRVSGGRRRATNRCVTSSAAPSDVLDVRARACARHGSGRRPLWAHPRAAPDPPLAGSRRPVSDAY